MIDNMHYFLSNTNGLKQLAINGENILLHTCEGFSYASKENTSIVVLKDTLYYFSESGFCSAKISGTQVENKLVSNVEVTNEKSVLVTDKEDRIWIINNQDGVIEYNTTKETEKQIANFPVSFNNNREDEIYTRASFYSNNYLYYITDNKMFSLDVTPQEDPDNPDNPTRPHDQSGHTCGLLGLEFIFILAGLSLLCKYHK